MKDSSPSRAVFERTVAYKAALEQSGCGGTYKIDSTVSHEQRLAQEALAARQAKRQRGYTPKTQTCEGRLILRYNDQNAPFIWSVYCNNCHHFRF